MALPALAGLEKFQPIRTIMRTRLLASLAGGLLGVALSSPINARLNAPPVIALVGCVLAGLALGYVASMLFDVFTASSAGNNVESGK